MAFTPRPWQVIQNQIKASVTAQPALSGLTSQSQAAHWQLWTFIQALGSNLAEQAMSVLFDEFETLISQIYPQTAPWIQARVLEFQYNTSTPYLVEINNGKVGYPTVVPADQIISNCAVVANSSGLINIKVTTGSPAAPLSADQVTALNSYLINFLAPNQRSNIISVAADQLLVAGTVYYNGQLNASIKDSVIAALNAYITNFSRPTAAGGAFNGTVKVSDIENIIMSVTGVTDWVPSQITMTETGGNVNNLVLAGSTILRLFPAYSGYIINDTTTPFSASLIFTPANV